MLLSSLRPNRFVFPARNRVTQALRPNRFVSPVHNRVTKLLRSCQEGRYFDTVTASGELVVWAADGRGGGGKKKSLWWSYC